MKKSALFIILIVLLCLASYANTLANEFVWDENVFIRGNTEIRQLSNIPKFFSEAEFGIYRPLRTALYALTYSAWEENPLGYHLNSLLWHTLISVLVFLIVKKLSKNWFVSLSAGLIFASIPIHIERVTNMTGGFDLMGIFFLLAAFYSYVCYAEEKKRTFLWLSITVFALALLSSEEAFTFPLMVLVYELIFNKFRFKEKSKTKEVGIFWIMLALFLALRVFVLDIGARFAEYPTGSFASTLLTMPKVFFYNLLLIFFPFKLNLLREISTSTFLDPMLYVSVVFFAAVIFLAVKFINKKMFSFFIFWFFITLLPFSNILPLQTLMADRYLYLPSLSAAVICSLGLAKIFERKKWLAIGILVLVVLVFSGLTMKGNTEWRDEVTLWSVTAERSPNTAIVFGNLGFAYERRGVYDKAEENFKKAIELDPTYAKAYYNLGTTYLRKEDYRKALQSFTAAAELDPSYYKAYDALGLTYYYLALQSNETRADLLTKAMANLRKSLEINPGFSKAYSDLGIVYGHIGEFEKAIASFEKAISLDEKNDEAYYNLGIVYEFLGDRRAKENFLKAYQLEPENKKYILKAGKVFD